MSSCMARIVWSVDPLAVSRLGQAEAAPPLTKKQLARIGIPAHKIPRVQQELARLAPQLEDVLAMEALAKQIARQLL